MKRVRNIAEFRKARAFMGMTLNDVALLLGLPNPEGTGWRTVQRWEKETVGVPGPARAAMEAALTGWRPTWWKKEAK